MRTFLKFFFIFLLYNIVLVSPYINMHPPQVYTCSPSRTPSTSLPVLSLWVIPVHQPQASYIMHGTWTGMPVSSLNNTIMDIHQPTKSHFTFLLPLWAAVQWVGARAGSLALHKAEWLLVASYRFQEFRWKSTSWN